MKQIITRQGTVVQDPPFATTLFTDTRLAWVWLVLRVWLGYKWIDASLHKLDNPAWMQTGDALKGFWTGAVAIPEGGRPAIAFDWYRSFIQFLLDAEAYTWFAKFVAVGEMLVGIALILGVFTGFAALFGALMNWNFMMAGSASTNPMLLIIAIGLILAWKIAGYIGLDRFVLPYVGTPWGRKQKEEVPEAQPAVA